MFIVEDDKNIAKDEDGFDFIEYYTNNLVKLDQNIKFLSREEANER